MADLRKKLQNQTNRQVEARAKEVKAFTLSLQKFFSKSVRSILKDLRSGDIRAREASRLLGSIMSNLEAGGLGDIVNQIEEIYAAELRAIMLDFDSTTGRELIITSSDIEDVEALINFQEQRIYSTVESYVDDTKATLMQQVIAGSVPDLDEIIDSADGRIAGNIETELNTALMSYNRALHANKAEEYGLDLFLYIGPDDKITRPFCSDVLSGDVQGVEPRDAPVYTKDEIESMNNGQDLPVITSGGGFNCRHHWRPITPELAAKLGYGDRD